MVILRDPSVLGQVEDINIRDLIAQRFQEMAVDGNNYDDLGMFVLAQPGDSIADLENAGGTRITTDIFTDSKYGDPDFSPSFDLLEEHRGHCWEMVHILNDSGYAVITIIPSQDGIDRELLKFCREYAVPGA